MKILIAGASGFIGRELTLALSEMHQITVLGRDLNRLDRCFAKNIDKVSWDSLSDEDANRYDLVINLSGANIGARRWSDAFKKELIESRTLTNKHLIQWISQTKATPRFFCANAIGIYGAEEKSEHSFVETDPVKIEPTDFLKQIGLAWEESLNPAVEKGIPVTTLRFGVVLKRGEGMLNKLELPFRLGLGSVLGHGDQAMSWIHYQDLIQAVKFLLEHPDETGPINLCAPFPLTQKEFAKCFAQVLNRPLLLKTPAWFVKSLFGEMGEYLLLRGQKVIPQRLTAMGFTFTYPDMKTALMQEYG